MDILPSRLFLVISCFLIMSIPSSEKCTVKVNIQMYMELNLNKHTDVYATELYHAITHFVHYR